MKNITKILFTILLSFSSAYAAAQRSDTLKIQRNAKGQITFVRFRPDKNRSMANSVDFLKSALHAGSDVAFRLIHKTTDAHGFTHQKYQQYYKGIKVENGQYLVHGKNGMIQTINGHFKQVHIPSVSSSITEKQALNKALAYVNAKKYKWQDSDMERFIKQHTNNPKATYYPKGELVIAMARLHGQNGLRLAWKFTISSLIPNNEQWIYVDATTGEIIGETPLIMDANVASTAQTMYSGTLGITGDSFSGGYRLRENRNGVSIKTLNLHGTHNYANATDFTNMNTNWTTGSWPDIVQDQQALDAHWGAEMVLDYWRYVQGRNSLDGNGIGILSYVHYTPSSVGTPWNNAAWVGGSNNFMQYGDGDGVTFNPLTALDVCAHEMGHGIAEFTANFHSTDHRQEGDALNEGFSDIWGACVEHWAVPNKQTWLMGEDIMASPFFTCLRDLQNPNSTTAAEGPHPDTYHGNFWSTTGEPHTNSTVLSHWFYLLSVGGSGTNDNSDYYSVSGIGINYAQVIAFEGETMLTSGADYMDARNMTIEAARQLIGAHPCKVISTTNAWYAVGVGDAFDYMALDTVNCNDYLCTSDTYSLPGLTDDATGIPGLPGATVTWSASPAGHVSLAPDGFHVTVTKIYGGYFYLTATITDASGNQHSVSRKIWAGTPSVYGGYSYNGQQHPMQYYNGSSTYNPVCDNAIATTNMEVNGAYSLSWQQISANPSSLAWGYGTTNNIHFYFWAAGQTEVFKVSASNKCGMTSHEFGFKGIDCSGGGDGGDPCDEFRVSPNPATQILDIVVVPHIGAPCNWHPTIVSSDEKVSSYSKINRQQTVVIQVVQMYNSSGQLVKQQNFASEDHVQLDVSELSSGIYFLRITSGDYSEAQSVVIGQ